MSTNDQNPLALPAADAVPQASKTILAGFGKKIDFVANLMNAFSPSPALLEAYITNADLVSKTSFIPKEQQAAALIISRIYACQYCLAARGTLGKSVGLCKETIVALQTRGDLNDERLEALRTLLLSLVESKGHPDPEAVGANAAPEHYSTLSCAA